MKRLAKGAQKTTPFMRLVPTSKRVLGVETKVYEPDGITRYCNFSTYGGTEKEVNGLLSVEDTAQIVAWYDPAIKGSDRIRNLLTGADYEILGQPENIEMRNQEMQFKVRRVTGGV